MNLIAFHELRTASMQIQRHYLYAMPLVLSRIHMYLEMPIVHQLVVPLALNIKPLISNMHLWVRRRELPQLGVSARMSED